MRRPPGPRAKESQVLTITLFVFGQLRSRLNGSGSRAHWSKIMAESNRWRTATTAAYLLAGCPTWDGSAQITFTAYVGRLWDDDNLPAALKVIRDTSVKAILGTDDGPTCGHTFTYRQEVRRDPAERGVLISVTPGARGAGGDNERGQTSQECNDGWTAATTWV